ncbi:MAG: GNAT family N-acetyltransferase [Treponema sp.]|nr:GNAT family N-acetyltransferase [Treponema sp.]
MKAARPRYTRSGHLFFRPGDNLDRLVDLMLQTGYQEEFCLALDFDPFFLADLMAAGFLVMSASLGPADGEDGEDGDSGQEGQEPRFLLLPKLHLVRSVLFWDELRETKSARRMLKSYELRYNSDFDLILENCVRTHGDGWLTAPLCESIRQIREIPGCPVQPVSFGVYREGELKAGEFGIIAGRVYTSYSGYHDENSSGTVQMLLTARWLRDRGFAFWDLGMPLDYKERLGARNLSPARFVGLFRGAAARDAATVVVR